MMRGSAATAWPRGPPPWCMTTIEPGRAAASTRAAMAMAPSSDQPRGALWAGHPSFQDLPEGVLAADPPVDELEQVTPAHLDAFPGSLGAAERPLGDAAVTTGPMPVVAVVDVRDTLEPRCDPSPDLLLAHHLLPSRRRPARQLKDAVLG